DGTNLQSPQKPDYQKQFQAAVRVIQGLPKNGSYRPSYEVMLRFYSYYKQATVGSCEIPRPGFWDPIGRYKWDAWNRLGKMSKEEAMAAYISEMKKVAQKVIDTIPVGEMSEDVFGFFEPLYEVIRDMPRPPESFFKKKAGKPGALGGWLGWAGLKWAEQQPGTPESSQVTSDAESEVYSDTLEQLEPELQAARGARGCPDADQGDTASAGLRPELDVQLLGTIRALQDNMRSVLKRLSHLETLSTAQVRAPHHAEATREHFPGRPSRWPLEVSARTLLFLLAWPFIVQWLLWRFQRRKRGLFRLNVQH
uniref:Acyl-CoA binding domain containing 4 n=1 Tax=Chelonoidis abingdonii TaxID=106734 RepID=A0A8C0GF99_CHEAB